MADIPKKIMLIGDGYTGKTSIVRCFAHKVTPGRYRPTIIDNFSASLKVRGRLRQIMIWDTSGQEDWAHIRRLAYFDCCVIIIVFDLSDSSSFDNVLLYWLPEVKEFCPNAPIILAGNKTDLRNQNHSGIGRHEGEKMAERIGAKCYIECSAVTDEGIDELFQKTGEVLFRSRFCTIL